MILFFFLLGEQKKKFTMHVGYITTFTIMKYGITRTGKPIYRCHPLDPSAPPCRIVYGGEKKGKIILVFKFPSNHKKEEKSDASGGGPLVELVHVIGVANRSNLLETLMYHCDVTRKSFKGAIANIEEKKIQREDCTALDLFSIDPLGCRDIDDAFSIECLTPTRTRLGVHIAQPIAFLDLDTILKRLEQGAFSTLYCEPLASETRPLWGKDIEAASSLLPDKIRPAYSVFFILEDGVIVTNETISKPTYVQNKLATHYDDVDNLLVQQLVEQTRRINGNREMHDTHDVVAYWMIQTNRYIGSAFPKLQLPYRVQQERSQEPTTVNEDLPKDIYKAFEQFSMDKARYSIDPGDQHHASLGMERYVHFTSPIRRIMDAMIHYQITYGITLEWEKHLERLCELDRATHRFHRMCRLVGVIDELFPPSSPSSTTTPLEMTGYLYEKIERGRWRVYFERLGFLKIRVVSHDLLHLFPEEQEEAEYPVGKALPFLVYPKKEGFLPMERILVLPGWKSLPS